LFLGFQGVDLTAGTTVSFSATEAFCLIGDCGFSVESTTFRFGGGTISSVPEPSTLALLALGLIGFVRLRKANHK
jgi:hypothetical protein